jgi:flagellar hook assembly protein FlgD
MLLNEEMLGRGEHELVWSGTDVHGRKMPSGTYFYRLQAGDYTETKRMTMLK